MKVSKAVRNVLKTIRFVTPKRKKKKSKAFQVMAITGAETHVTCMLYLFLLLEISVFLKDV